MDLILWRHAEADDGSPDAGRKLTAKGERQARATADWLRPRLPQACRVLVSPALRTLQTAQALTEAFETSPEVGVGVSPKTILQAVGWPAATGACLVVGHQPTLGMVVSQLLCRVPDGVSFKKSSVWWINAIGNKTTLRAMMSPELLGEPDLD